MNALVPLGDQAALASFVDENGAFQFATSVRQVGYPWLVDVVQAYLSVGVFFDLDRINFAAVSDALHRLTRSMTTDTVPSPPSRLHQIPCCYDLQEDLSRVAEHTGLSPAEIIHLHAATEYTVYAIGFSPGFPYLGYLPTALCGVPRLATPRKRVNPGSVGITGRQTGIYPEVRPGGWNLIGRTPLRLVDVADGYFPLRTGDRVRFQAIDEAEFRRREGQRL
jgi:inhibitor of KinA